MKRKKGKIKQSSQTPNQHNTTHDNNKHEEVFKCGNNKECITLKRKHYKQSGWMYKFMNNINIENLVVWFHCIIISHVCVCARECCIVCSFPSILLPYCWPRAHSSNQNVYIFILEFAFAKLIFSGTFCYLNKLNLTESLFLLNYFESKRSSDRFVIFFI